MRQILIQVPRGCGQRVLELVEAHDGLNVACLSANGLDGRQDLIIVHISNRQVEALLKELESVPELHLTLLPRGVIVLRPPAAKLPEQIRNVEARSPIEIFIDGLQSVGSWKGFLGYAITAGIVVWIGLFTNTSYLLVAAMLLAPFAGPAMNVAIATARGDQPLLKQSLWRYLVALAVTILVAALLSLVLQQQIPTSLMVERSQISTVAVLLPLAAGTAGALNLAQSERNSLVSGAAVGMLVAASLAPPAGIVGMAAVIGRWDMVVNGLFLLLLQLVGINLSAALVFRAYGVSAQGARYQRGKRWVFPAVLAGTVVILLGLLSWQFADSPNFQHSSRAQRANAEIQQVVEQSDWVELVEANLRFTRPNIQGQNTLLGTIYVQRRAGVNLSDADIRNRLTQDIQTRLLEQGFEVTPLMDVTVLSPPKDKS
ncbi:MAG: TIGR00341 family protein [Elainella sp. C42_A2020_010]|nr:TIGR00341 family protein [Elainella sp. C42_A2020_010]RNJ65537.1 MAG: TIGR00341 family protein [Leptolyngbya sp. IPPAS B-1204]